MNISFESQSLIPSVIEALQESGFDVDYVVTAKEQYATDPHIKLIVNSVQHSINKGLISVKEIEQSPTGAVVAIKAVVKKGASKPRVKNIEDLVSFWREQEKPRYTLKQKPPTNDSYVDQVIRAVADIQNGKIRFL